jgi:chromosome segregation ATPase
LKERLETLQKSLAAERKEHEREIQLLEFLRSEDAGEAMKREESMRQQIAEVERRLVETEGQLAAHLGQVAALQSRINELEAASTNSRPSDEREKHVTLMHSKIEKLRIERDDLRQKLSYLTHENRFALRAAEADKMSAVEDLHRVRADLRQKTSAYEVLEADSASLQDRVVSITARLQSAEASFAAASTDKHDLADRVAQLELDLDRAVKERDDNKVGLVQLASDHARVQTENAAAKQELEIAQKQQRNLEEEVDRLRAGSNAQGPSAEVVQGEEPRRRTSSGASVKELDDVQQMANDLRARLGRRERASLHTSLDEKLTSQVVIANLQRDLQKERANCAAAGDAVAEHEAEKQALEIALESARQELESKATEIFSLASQLDDARAELGQNAQTLRISQEETEALRVEEAALREQLAVMKDEMSTLSSESSELKGSSAAVVEHLEQARRTEARLRAEVDTSRAEVDILQQQLSTARQRSVESSAATITSLETERNQAQSRMGELEMQLSEVLDKLAAGEKKRAETESLTVSELDEATTRLAELEKAVSAKGERVGELENEVKVLVDELSSAETAHGEALQEAEAKYAELQSKHDGSVKEGQGREATLRLEIKGYSKKVEEVEILLQDSRADLETEKSRADALLLTADERRVIIDSLRAKVDELEAGSTSAAERSLALESEMAQLREQLAMAIDKEVAIARDLENITATYGEALLAIEKLEVQVNEARSREEQREATIQSLREEMAKLEEQAQKTAESLATQEGEAKKL